VEARLRVRDIPADILADRNRLQTRRRAVLKPDLRPSRRDTKADIPQPSKPLVKQQEKP